MSDLYPSMNDMKMLTSKVKELESKVEGLQEGIGIANSRYKEKQRESKHPHGD